RAARPARQARPRGLPRGRPRDHGHGQPAAVRGGLPHRRGGAHRPGRHEPARLAPLGRSRGRGGARRPLPPRARTGHPRMIGKPLTRLGAEGLLTGGGRFVGAVRLPSMAEAAVLRPPHAHARIVQIDPRPALAVPGVLAVLTAGDIPEAAVIPIRVPAPDGTAVYLQPAMARGVTRYAGE